MEIDFTKDPTLNESYYQALGAWSQLLMNLMYPDMPKVATLDGKNPFDLKEEETGSSEPQVIIRGKYPHVKAYAQALGREHDYIVALAKYGEKHPITAKNKAQVDSAASKFTRLTGLEWPFK